MYIRTNNETVSFTTSPAGATVVRATISKWGNSLGVRIPKAVAQDAGLVEGSIVDLRVENGRLVAELLSAQSLESLLTRITSENLHRSLVDDTPRGREVW